MPFPLMVLGAALLVIGIFMIVLSLLSAPNEFSMCGIILIGPFPIVFGRDSGLFTPLIIVAVILSFSWIIINLYFYRK